MSPAGWGEPNGKSWADYWDSDSRYDRDPQSDNPGGSSLATIATAVGAAIALVAIIGGLLKLKNGSKK